MRLASIGECIEKVRSWSPARDSAEQMIDYIDLGAVDNEHKVVVGSQSVIGREAPSRARQKVIAGDILVSTVRPYLNGVARVPKHLDGATASTGFCVLRPSTGKIDPAYLFQWVKSPEFVTDMVRKSTGASYPAVSDRIICDSLVPLPPLPEQRRIAAILDQADALRRLHKRAFGVACELPHSIFRDSFGDLVSNERGFAAGMVADLVSDFNTGKNLAPASDDIDATHRVLKVSAVTSGKFLPGEAKPLPPTYSPPQSHFVRRGDLLFSRANTEALIGATAIVDKDPMNIVLPDKIWRFQWSRGNEAVFTHYLFQSKPMRREISRRASGTSGSMKNIGKEKVLSIPIGIPPQEARREFERLVSAADHHCRIAEEGLRRTDSLFASLQHRAFRGEL